MGMPEPFGRTLPLSLPRRFVCDLMHLARQVPTVPVQRRMNLSNLVAARRLAVPKPSWCAIFTKAYGFVAAARPEFRRAYIPFPRPRLYEHPNNIASIAIERRLGDEDAVFFAHLRNPEKQSLPQIDSFLKYCKEEPLTTIGLFRWTLQISRLPQPLRRLAWWFANSTSGYRRARWMGTFGVSVYSALGAESLHPLSPLTTALNYGVIRADGEVDVRIIYDHRVVDGATVARALLDLEKVLNQQILGELQGSKEVHHRQVVAAKPQAAQTP
jgi:hypothetical protein